MKVIKRWEMENEDELCMIHSSTSVRHDLLSRIASVHCTISAYGREERQVQNSDTVLPVWAEVLWYCIVL
jgi:hypothetical protein